MAALVDPHHRVLAEDQAQDVVLIDLPQPR
jgi:hypothetical protein